MSETSTTTTHPNRRLDTIRGLTQAQEHYALVYLSGAAPLEFDLAIEHITSPEMAATIAAVSA